MESKILTPKNIKSALKMAWLAGWMSHSPYEVDEIVEGLFKDLVARSAQPTEDSVSTTTKQNKEDTHEI